MPSAIYAAPFVENIGPVLPPIVGDGDELQLGYINEAGELCGGYSAVGNIPYPAPPLPPNTCLVRVWSSEETLDALAASDDYLFVEDVDEVPDAV
jgi:hypothetical protein